MSNLKEEKFILAYDMEIEFNISELFILASLNKRHQVLLFYLQSVSLDWTCRELL